MVGAGEVSFEKVAGTAARGRDWWVGAAVQTGNLQGAFKTGEMKEFTNSIWDGPHCKPVGLTYDVLRDAVRNAAARLKRMSALRPMVVSPGMWDVLQQNLPRSAGYVYGMPTLDVVVDHRLDGKTWIVDRKLVKDRHPVTLEWLDGE